MATRAATRRVTVQGRTFTVRDATPRRAARRSSSIRLPRPSLPGKLPPISVNPRDQVQYATRNTGSAIAFLFGLLVAIDLLRRGFPGTPGALTKERAAAYLGAGIVFGVAATFAPGFAPILLVGVLVISALRAAPAIEAWITRLSTTLRAAPSPTTPTPT